MKHWLAVGLVFVFAFSPGAFAKAVMPVIEVPAPSAVPPKDSLCIFYSGDGGWAKIDQAITGVFAEQGFSCVGIDSRKYFRSKKEPDEFTRDLEDLIRRYLKEWSKEKLILMGYSRGADVLPFAFNRLSEDLKSRTKFVVLIGPEKTIDFQFHALDLIDFLPSEDGSPVGPEIQRIKGPGLLCVYGEGEEDTSCPVLPRAQQLQIPGEHHFDKKYRELAALILQKISE